MIDGVGEVVPGERAICRKTFSPDDPVFSGHFPGDPLVPGVLLAEGMAQTAGIAAADGEAGRRFYLSAIRTMKFLRAIRPGATVEYAAEKTAVIGGLWQFAVRATSDGDRVAEGSVVLASVG
jgi:3-hydroxyacyl-[acyl-carrier-protein] dehydratase